MGGLVDVMLAQPQDESGRVLSERELAERLYSDGLEVCVTLSGQLVEELQEAFTNGETGAY